MKNGTIHTRSVCPHCDEPLRLQSARDQVCIVCQQPVRLSWSYRREITYIAFLFVVLIGLATYNHASAGPWIIGLLLFWAYITFLLSFVVSPKYERGYYQPQFTFVASFFTMFVAWFLADFLGFLTAYVVLGAKPGEIQELLDFLSIPLGWFSSQFVITPNKTFIDVIGIMLGNSFFIAIPIFLCVKGVQAVMRQSRVTQMGISQSIDDVED